MDRASHPFSIDSLDHHSPLLDRRVKFNDNGPTVLLDHDVGWLQVIIHVAQRVEVFHTRPERRQQVRFPLWLYKLR